MISVLLDTCVIIDLDRVDLGDNASATAFVSAVTIAELAYGLDVDDPVERNARTERYYATLEQFDVLPFDIPAAKLYGTMAALVKRSGRNLRLRRMDLRIAATAAANGLPLLTRNATDSHGLERVLDVISI
ncbi:type II toxin-antitoxin system VapC family toxin [Actinokineospora xionganensis]|uniref:Ribonuclease VapC n=1 Tax=Actinokineospora xionganensis TaxID=2684470 RepID=A0ABR7LA95_9PSEU|nr:type II toxin-antitoxin system VapC family toxin [Actinokineospora xionganensis]MBC6449463.1 type II toxin-antitoxin system VapC family toxin [Actinokineospora xionganensis]